MYAQPVQNTLPGNIVLRDITLTYMPERSEIVPFIEYMVGRESGRYLASHPSWYRKQRQLQANHSYLSENHAIADTASSFRPETLLQPYALPSHYPIHRLLRFNKN